MTFFRSASWLLVLGCLAWSTACLAQPVPPTAAEGRAAVPAADTATVAALHALFRAKRRYSDAALIGAPVAALVAVGSLGVLAVSQLSNNEPNNTLPVLGIVGGSVLAIGLLNHYTRYTPSRERKMLAQYEQTHTLPKWVSRNLERRRARKQ
ncbi:hypothetical protein [Hymenobacter rubidus]|uniref:hypothetical protein n=1 Tax=Hymenobacter rubidus TaxID=1441626 RepID=UPI00191CB271|nr:hypothetical protein [Hymenobacter rubidus]